MVLGVLAGILLADLGLAEALEDMYFENNFALGPFLLGELLRDFDSPDRLLAQWGGWN